MTEENPFRIGQQGVKITASPDRWRARFAEVPALSLQGTFDPAFLCRLIERAAKADFVEDPVEHVGHRAIEEPQRIGKALSLLFHSPDMLAWLEQATGIAPIKAIAGRLAEMRMNSSDQLGWHDDRQDTTRQLAIIVDLSERAYGGGQFQLRRKGDTEPLLKFDHPAPGSIMIFAVAPELEHRVLAVSSGGPRRVYAGWFLSQPEHEAGTLSRL